MKNTSTEESSEQRNDGKILLSNNLADEIKYLYYLLVVSRLTGNFNLLCNPSIDRSQKLEYHFVVSTETWTTTKELILLINIFHLDP